MLKVLEILKNFFQEVFKQGLGQSPKVLSLLSGSGESASEQIPLDGIWLGAAGIGRAYTATEKISITKT